MTNEQRNERAYRTLLFYSQHDDREQDIETLVSHFLSDLKLLEEDYNFNVHELLGAI